MSIRLCFRTEILTENLLDAIGIHGFGQVFVKPGCLGSLNVRLLSPAGHREQESSMAPRLLSETACHLVPRDVWHAYVEDRGVRSMLDQFLKRFLTAVRNCNRIAGDFKEQSQCIRGVAIVIRHQNVEWRWINRCHDQCRRWSLPLRGTRAI